MVQMEFLGMNFTCVLGSLCDGKFPEKDCLLPLISKLLGYAIVAASTTVKVPQIMKILQHKSVRGLSVVAFEMEVVGYTIALAYCLHKGLPFSAYGKLAFLLIQAIILVATIYYFSQPVGNSTWIRALLYCGLAPTILAGKIDPLLFEALYASQHAIFFFARVPQIWENLKAFKALLTSASSEERLTALGELMYQCHYSYSACGLGSDGTDRLVQLVQEMQHNKSKSSVSGDGTLYGAKITCGGSGGTVCVIGRNCLKSSEQILQLANLTNLEILYLSYNKMSGIVPAGLAHIPKLTYLRAVHGDNLVVDIRRDGHEVP